MTFHELGTRTVAQAIAYGKSSAMAPQNAPDGTWEDNCASAVYRLSGRTAAGLPTANAAGQASRIVCTDASLAPAGCKHFWSDPSFGHTAYSLGGGRTAMASTWVMQSAGHPAVWHTNLGVVDIDAYSAAHPNLTYRGWALDYAGTVTPGVIVMVRVPDRPEVWQINPDLTRTHLDGAAYRALRQKGVHTKPTTAALLAQFDIA